ncbi:hypothetical protein AVEN_177315-1 [Araneus ventricosus]|uniref:Uncharacterized protein n=1 Tax=Araneus ventricosus TaxID=182803 RepID=A0A4Y2C4G0_ARAVE|nr:hypothetical protein AVEN_177315-1 [Araneus ventricosus]
MEAGQEEMKDLIRARQERMKKWLEEIYRSKFIQEGKKKVLVKGQQEVKILVQGGKRVILEVKDDVQRKTEEVKTEVQRQIEEEKSEAQSKISDTEKSVIDLEIRPNNVPGSLELMYDTVKPLTFDGQTPWTIFKTQFDVVSSVNGWMDRVKASQLVASI